MHLHLDTIILFVQDVDNLKHFYADVLGLDIVEEDSSVWVLLRAGNAHLGLHKIGEQYLSETEDRHKFENNTKIVFDIEHNIREARQLLIDKNVLIGAIKTFHNYDYWLCDGEDPEGNVFQIRQRKNPTQTN